MLNSLSSLLALLQAYGIMYEGDNSPTAARRVCSSNTSEVSFRQQASAAWNARCVPADELLELAAPKHLEVTAELPNLIVCACM